MTEFLSTAGPVPLPPKNLSVTSPYQVGMLDLRWDDPTTLARNASFTLVGVNIYRSEASDRGPYRRINEFPIGGLFYRDRTDYARIDRELVPWNTGWIFRGDGPNNRQWVLRTRHPIAQRFDSPPHQEPAYALTPHEVTLWINGAEVPVHSVFGKSGEVTLINAPFFDPVLEKNVLPVLPDADSVVEISYQTPKNHVRSGLDLNIWYRVTSVALDPSTPSGYVESPLEWCEPRSVMEIEHLDYIWREAMRRNAWILQQGGERVKFFVRKTAGVICNCCLDERTLAYGKQPSSRCLLCFGTGFLRGYEGPYEGVIAPDDAERRITQAVAGRHKEHTYEVWTGVSPQLTQRDFLVKQTNERYSIGPVRRPSHRGNYMQQHFNIRYLDEGDIRYRVPVDGTNALPWPGTRGATPPPVFTPRPVDGALHGDAPWPVGTDNVHPAQTGKDNIPDEVQQRGRTRVWENTQY